MGTHSNFEKQPDQVTAWCRDPQFGIHAPATNDRANVFAIHVLRAGT
jgi:hypothetical protein